MSGTVLDKIVKLRREDIAVMAQAQPLSTFKDSLTKSDRDFYQAIEARKAKNLPSYILECKRSSPSKGLIREDFDLEKIVTAYSAYATAISVLTESRHFGGDFKNITIAKTLTSAPILCKDFIVDAYQIYLARFHGAN